MRRAVVVLALSAVACGSRSPVGAQPSWRHHGGGAPTATQVIDFRPPGPAVASYNDPPATPAPRSALDDAVTAAVARAAASAGRAAPVADGRLFKVCDELAAITPDDAPLDYSLIEFALQREGIVEPSPHLLVIHGPADAPDEIVAQLDQRLPAILAASAFARIGVGTVDRAGDDDVILLALQQSFVTLSPVPRTIAADGAVALEGEIAASFHDPEVFVTREGGLVEQPTVTRRGERGFHARLACAGHQGKQQIEIVAADDTGATVLANFPVWCDEQPPDHLAVEVDPADSAPVTTPAAAEDRMIQMINRDRTRAGLAALARDDRLARVGRAHSHEMHDTGVVAHISPTTGSAADRVRGAGIKSSIVLENVARAYSVAEAEQGLMDSPGHRANILSPEVSHVGVGVVLGDEVSGRRELLVTQLFIKIPLPIDPTKVADDVKNRIEHARGIVEDAQLSRLAEGMAGAMAKGDTAQAAATRFGDAVRKLGGTYSKVTTLATTVADLAGFDPEASLGAAGISQFGVGVAQGDSADMGAQAIDIVILLGYK